MQYGNSEKLKIIGNDYLELLEDFLQNPAKTNKQHASKSIFYVYQVFFS